MLIWEIAVLLLLLILSVLLHVPVQLGYCSVARQDKGGRYRVLTQGINLALHHPVHTTHHSAGMAASRV